MKTLDIHCPLCGASKGGACRDVNNHAYMLERPHRERTFAAKALREGIVVKWFLESTDTKDNDWYVCWHEFFDSKEEAQDKLDALGWEGHRLNGENGKPIKFRVKNHRLVPA